MTNRLGIRTVALLLLGAIGEGVWERAEVAAEPLSVFVGIPPQAYLVERVGREHVLVNVLVQPGQDPHTFEPTPKQLLSLARAKLLFKTGMPFEDRLLEKIRGLHRRLVVVDTAAGIKGPMMAADDHGHHAARPDPHVWLSPPLLKIQAANIAAALVRADPLHADDYRKNLAAVWSDIERTHARIGRMLKPYKGRSFYVFHPAFGCFGDAYGLKQRAVEAEGKIPTPKQLRLLVNSAVAEGVKVVFVQPQFDQGNARAVARAIGGTVVPIDPLAKDLLRNLEEMSAKIERAFKQQRLSAERRAGKT